MNEETNQRSSEWMFGRMEYPESGLAKWSRVRPNAARRPSHPLTQREHRLPLNTLFAHEENHFSNFAAAADATVHGRSLMEVARGKVASPGDDSPHFLFSLPAPAPSYSQSIYISMARFIHKPTLSLTLGRWTRIFLSTTYGRMNWQ